MFGHLSAEDFTNLLEGSVLPERLQDHLSRCRRCKTRFDTVLAVRQEITAIQANPEGYIPEPNWENFRSDVRNSLLARSVKREHSPLASLLGFRLQPSMAWGASLVLLVGITLGVTFWGERHGEPEPGQLASVEDLYAEPEAISSLVDVRQVDVFDELIHLNSDEAESLQSILNELTVVSEQ